MATESAPVDVSQTVNEHLGGFNKTMGLRFVRATPDEVEAELTIAEQHLQPYGIVHGGVHAAIIETACSTGAALFALQNGQSAVGLENSTSFLRAAREGRITVTARPLVRGRKSQVWEATVKDAAGKLLATGRVRLLCLDEGASLAGKKVEVLP